MSKRKHSYPIQGHVINTSYTDSHRLRRNIQLHMSQDDHSLEPSPFQLPSDHAIRREGRGGGGILIISLIVVRVVPYLTQNMLNLPLAALLGVNMNIIIVGRYGKFYGEIMISMMYWSTSKLSIGLTASIAVPAVARDGA